tara:strand:- start:187 stop:513 length:327 start_codon:yes stop_codon:yes gene_type:complete
MTKKELKENKHKAAITSFFNFIFSNAIGISGIIMLICFSVTGLLIYLKIALILSSLVTGLIFVLSTQGLYVFGIDKCYVEIEAKFTELTLYSALILGNLIFLTVEISK